jgi:NADPH:quinone reductase-like Zn-dependent oxidoreductase
MSNQAAWITAPKAKPFKIDMAPMPEPEPHEVVLRNYAAAINPADWKTQEMGGVIAQYPSILGIDAAGEVVAVGSAVTRFQTGDRVIAHCDGLMTGKASNNGFQLFCATTAKLVAKLPDHIDYTHGGVLPLAISTAAAGLFQKQALGLPHPTKHPKPTGQVLVVWGGSSSCGSVAIQLAVAAGVEVAAIASSHNHDYLKKLGATFVFDYNDGEMVDRLVSVLSGRECAGVFDAISLDSTIRESMRIVSRLKGKKMVATVLPVPEGVEEIVKTQFGESWQVTTKSIY